MVNLVKALCIYSIPLSQADGPENLTASGYHISVYQPVFVVSFHDEQDHQTVRVETYGFVLAKEEDPTTVKSSGQEGNYTKTIMRLTTSSITSNITEAVLEFKELKELGSATEGQQLPDGWNRLCLPRPVARGFERKSTAQLRDIPLRSAGFQDQARGSMTMW